MTKYLQEHYNLLSLIHKSDATELWLIEDALTKEHYVLKIIERKGLLYSKIAELKHKNLPKIFYVEETDTTTYVVEEYLRGQNLQEYIDEHGDFDEKTVARLGIELCSCLEALHAKHIIHRDIKPTNLFMTEAGELKLIDFDAARLEKLDSVADTHLIGTPGFAAPEQYGFHQTDERTDIYSLGLTLKILAGYMNYHGYLTAIFDKCTEFDPTKRYDSAKTLRRAIIFRVRLHDWKKFFVASIAGTLSLAIYFFSTSTPIEQKNPPSPTNIEPITEENVYEAEPQNFSQAEPTSEDFYAEPVVKENFYQPEQPTDNPVEEIITETVQIVSEKDLEPPPQMPRRDFANQMRNLNLSEEELDAKQEEYQQKLEMNQRIREFKKELPDDLSDDERREAIRIYTLQEKEKLREK